MTLVVRAGGPAAALVAVGLLVSGCAGSDGARTTAVTLPASLDISTTVSAEPAEPTTTAVPPTSPAATGAPVIVSLDARQGAASCVAGTIPVTVTFELEPVPPVRVVSVFLDGAPAGSSTSTTEPITVPAVACDGAAHTLLLIAAGTDGATSTQAVAFRSPRG